MGYLRRRYRKTFGHRSPFRRTYGSRNAGQAIGTTYRTLLGPARDIAKLAAEVRGIKSRQNVEKKHKEKLLTGDSGDEAFEIGQVIQNGEGMYALDVTPSITQGIQHDQRIGNSLKMTGMVFKYQMQGQANLHQKHKVKLTLVKVSSPDIASVSGSEVQEMIWDPNPLTNVRDTNAPLNYATLKQNGIKIIRQHTITLPAQDLINPTGTGPVYSAAAHKTGKFSVKMQDIIRYASASATSPEGFKYLLFLQADTGNSSANDSTKTDIPITEALTGSMIRMHSKYWWVDN